MILAIYSKCNYCKLLLSILLVAVVLSGCDRDDVVTLDGSTTYNTIAGTVIGLTGSGLVLQNNAGDDLAITANGSFVFSTVLSDGDNYLASIATQPTSPNQVCSVSLGSGTVSGADVTNILVNCIADTYSVSGFVTGLSGSGLVLQNNAGDDLAIAADGGFVFSSVVNNGAAYAVSVLTSPSSLNQICTIINASGTISTANVTDVLVACVTDNYTIGGSITGLTGTGLILENNGGNDLAVSTNGSFTFSTALADGSAYVANIQAQPTSLNQICSITSPSGTLAGGNITNIAINCVTNTYTVSGTVSGLNGVGLTLQNNAGDDLAVAADGTFTFATPVTDGAAYAVSVLTQPSTLNQTCSVTTGSGGLAGSNISNVVVSCVNTTYTVGGSVSGLAGTGLILENTGGDDLVIAANGLFAFSTALADGSAYNVAVQTQPGSLNQTCTVTSASGNVAGSNVTSVVVTCVTDTYIAGGFITGLIGSGLVLQNNASDDLAIAADGSFSFSAPVADGGAYALTVLTAATLPSQVCSISNATGSMSGGDLTGVIVSCTAASFTVSGTVTGLAGGGLVLQNNGGDDIAIGVDGGFTFGSAIDDATAYSVSILSQPNSPEQTCTLGSATGVLSGSNITNVTLNCVTNTYTVGGFVTGLSGAGLVLQNNAGDNLAIAADGSFTFAAALNDTAAYAVSVLTAPTGPVQACTITNGSGSLSGADVTNVSIACTTNVYTVGGTFTGYTGSSGLILQNNGGDDLAIIGADGSFVFTSPVADTDSYAVSVLTQPGSPNQSCNITNNSGVIAGGNISNVSITCSTSNYTIAGIITGLAGSGLVLQNNLGDDLAISADGSFIFATALADLSTYSVSVLTQPSTLNQSCVITNASGTLAGANISNVAISCTTTTYTVGGTVTGLAGAGLILQNNGGDNLAIAADGPFTFASPLDDGSVYAVSVLTQPGVPSQSCSITNAGASLSGSNTTNVTVTCTTDTYTVSGIATGLAGTGLVLQNNAGDNLSVAADGSFTFATSVIDGAAYAVSVLTQPSGLNQSCAVTSASGTISSSDIIDVSVNCTTSSYTVGGTVSGLAGTGLVLENNAGDDLIIATDGAFTFSSALIDGSSYAVALQSQPNTPTQTCSVTNGSSTLSGANVTSVLVNCTTSNFTVGGIITGLTGSGLVIQNNAGDDLAVAVDGSFTFATAQLDGSAYAVSVLTQATSPNQTCSVTNGSGNVSDGHVNTVSINCVTSTYTVGGNVSGLTGSGLVLQNNGGDNLAIAADGSFTFATSLNDGGAYAVSVQTQPSTLNQTCTVTNDAGNLAGSNITNVAVTCVNTNYTIGGIVTGLAGTGLVLQNNAGDDLSVGADGSFVFSTAIADGSTYIASVLTQPTALNQTCSVSSNSGTISGGAISNILVNCVTDTFTIGGTVTGLAGTGLILENNAGNDLAIAADGSFVFTAGVIDGASYAVTVGVEPGSLAQTCSITNGSGTVSNSNVTNVAVNCVTNTYTVGGTVTGLTGTGLLLQNNAGDDLSIAADGNFTFATSMTDGASYLVSVATQPNTPQQACTVTLSSGTLDGANVSNVLVNCIADTYTVSGFVSGLAGTGLILQNNAGDDLAIAADGSFVFSTVVNNGEAYAVTVSTSPSALNQSCSITNASGTISTANVTDVLVDCVTANYTIGGTITGLVGTGLILENNGGDDLVIAAASTSFTFSTSLTDGTAYAAIIQAQPGTPNQVCAITAGSGTLAGSNISNIAIACTTNTYTVGGTVTGLAGSGLVLQNNTGDDLAIAADGTFTFATPVTDGIAYAVTVLTQATTPNQVCSVTAGGGSLAGSNITDVVITCVTSTYTVGGTVTGLAGSGLTLHQSGSDTLAIAADGSFIFSTALNDGSAYIVSVDTQPGNVNQICTVTNDSGNLAGGNVTDVLVSCVTNNYIVNGFVTGLAGSGLVLQNNLADDLAITADGSFSFSTGTADGTAYAVSILAQPTGLNQTCSVSNVGGTIAGVDINNVTVSCSTNSFSIGGTGTITGLVGTGLLLENNGGDDLLIAPADTNFTFASSLLDGSAYAVSIATPASSPDQTCTLTNASGVLSGSNVTNIAINCVTNSYTVGGTVSGLAGTGLVLQNSAGDDLGIAVDGSFTFATAVTDLAAYDVLVSAQPTGLNQFCSVAAGSGNLAGSNITDVVISCVTNNYTISGSIVGLAGSGLTLENNGGDDLVIASGATSFTFSTAQIDGSAYSIGVQTQPGGLDQTCTLTNAAGNVSGANVTTAVLTCVTDGYTVGGFVTGLTGSGLVLQNNTGDDLNVGGDGSFNFITPVIDGAGYSVSVLTQPGTPTQVCTASSNTGTISGANVASVVVSCSTSSFTIGGTVNGLLGSGLVLQNNGGDDLAIGIDGSFTFTGAITDATDYAVSVLAQANSPSQSCAITSGFTGTVAGSNVTDVVIDCVTDTFTVGGVVTGYTASTGLVLQNNGGDNLAIGVDGSFTFAAALNDGSGYAVTVFSSPTGPIKACNITNGSGSLSGADVTNVNITCTTSVFTVGGTVTGLTGSGFILQNNGGNDLAIAADGGFVFTNPVADTGSYAVSVLSQPNTPAQNCNIANNSGVIAGANISNVTITCSTSNYTIAGTISGLAGSGLVLQNNLGDDLSVSANGSFIFATALADLSGYSVSVLTPPSTPNQSCVITNASGTLASANISNVAIVCTTTPYTVGGTVAGLAGTGLILQNNGGDNLAIAADGVFTFASSLNDGSAYAVSVLTQPGSPSQSCSITNAGASLAGSNVTNVAVVCTTDTYTVSGFVNGLAGSGFVLQNNAGDDLALAGNGSFTFSTPVTDGNAYAVTVLTQPGTPNQVCSVSNPGGTINSSDVTNVSIDCVTSTYTVGGTVSGLTGSGLVLENNAGDDLVIAADGVFTFSTALTDGTSYLVNVQTQANTPSQTCSVTNDAGILSGSNVSNVTVSCVTDSFTVGGAVTGLAGSGLVLQNNAGDDLAIAADGTFTFATSITDSAAYAVTVLTQPTTLNQSCSVTTGSGNLAGSNIIDVAVDCVNNSYTVGGTVTGLSGTGLLLENNGGDDLIIAADGSFTFVTALADGSAFAASVAIQPDTPNQTCSITNATGTISGSNITTINVSCVTDAFTVGGFISGLAGTGLVLQNNAGDDLIVGSNDSFTFSTSVTDGTAYAVTVLTQPSSLSQTCSVSSGSGTVSGGSVSNVLVNCVTAGYTIGGTVSGLAGSGMVLINNGGDDIAIGANGSFTFPASVEDGTAYVVAIQTLPTSPSQFCSVTNGSSVLNGANVTDIIVNCTTDDFTVGGTVLGLEGSGLVLQNNAGDNLSVSANGNFTFATALPDSSVYAVTVLTQPTSVNQICTLTSGSGTISGDHISSVTVNCITEKYTVGGSVTGLAGSGLTLENLAGNSELTITADGSFTFVGSFDDGTAHDVHVIANPSNLSQTCVTNAAHEGLISGSNVTDIAITCTTNTYTVGGIVTGLAGTGMVLDFTYPTGNELMAIAADGSFEFTTAIEDSATYTVSVQTPPGSLSQTCSVSNATGTINADNISDISVNCVTDTYTIAGNVFGLAGSGLTLENNGGDDLSITADGSFTFTLPVTDGNDYAVTVAIQPAFLNQVCTVTNDTGTLSGANVSNVTVNCVTELFTVGGVVNGLDDGDSVVLQNNGGDDLTVTELDVNLALTGTASLSSTLLTFTADKAIDGNTAGTDTNNNIAHSIPLASSTEWWQVDLGAVQLISRIQIWNRDNCCQNRLANMYVMVADTPFPADANDLAGALANADFTFQLSATEAGDPIVDVSNVAGRYVRLQKSGTNPGGDSINIAEVEVFGTEFTFPTPLGDGSDYEVTILTQPADHLCTVINDTGTLAGSNVTNVIIDCEPTVAPGIPVVTLSYDIKTLRFNWTDTLHARTYRLMEDIDGASGYSAAGGDITGLSVDRAIPFLPDHLNARYIVTACNVFACTDSAPVFMDNNLLAAIGYFKASNTGAGDQFGRDNRIDLSDDGNTMVVGAPTEDSNASGIDGNQLNNSLLNSGAVYVYVRDSATNIWSQQAYIKASNPGSGDLFGGAVALSGDSNTLAVGGQREDSAATGVNGDEADNSVSNSGAVYIFTRTGTTWNQQAYIKASNTGVNDEIGNDVKLNFDGNTLAAGVFRENSAASGIDGDGADNSAGDSGAAYVFTRSGTTWTQQAYIKAAVPGTGDHFGIRVSISDDGNTLAAGARQEDGGIAGVNGDQTDNSRSNSGAVYVFTRTAGVWSQQSYIKPDRVQNTGACGFETKLSGDGLTLVAGCVNDASNAIGINGDQTNTSMSLAGAAYVWIFDAGTWSQQAYVKASNTQASDQFGNQLSISSDGNRLVASARGEDSSAVGINGDDSDNGALGSGAVYLYYRDGGLTGTWSQHAYIKASNTGASDLYQSCVLSGDGNTLAVGAINEDSNATGLSGDQNDNSTGNSGAVYLY